MNLKIHDRMQTFKREELNRIHRASMDILENIGIAFNESEALEIFKGNGPPAGEEIQ